MVTMTVSNSLGLVTSHRLRPTVHERVMSEEPHAVSGQTVPRSRLLVWNAALFLFHATLAALTLGLGNRDLKVPTYKTEIEFVPRGNRSSDGWDLVPSYKPADGLYFTLLAAAFFILSAVFHLLNATLLRGVYLRELSECRTPTRWIEYFFSASVMQVLIAYTMGIRERSLLLAIAVLVAVTMPFGYWTELLARPASPDEWTEPLSYRLLPWFLGNVPQCTAWFIVLFQFYDGSAEPSMIPWFVHLILWGELILFFSFGFVQLAVQCLPPKRFYQGELAFQALSLGSKGLLGGILLSQVLMLSRFDEVYD